MPNVKVLVGRAFGEKCIYIQSHTYIEKQIPVKERYVGKLILTIIQCLIYLNSGSN